MKTNVDYMTSSADVAILSGTNTTAKRNLLLNDMGVSRESYKMKHFNVLQYVLAYSIIFTSSAFSAIYWCPDLAGDDNNVNFADLAVLAENWRQAGTGLEGDFDNSGIVDLKDLRHLACYWLTHADVWGVGTTIQTFNSYPSDWSAYIGSGSSGSSYSWISCPAGYLKTNFKRNANNDGVAKIYIPIGNLYPAGTTAGNAQESWMQVDIKSLSGSSAGSLWFGIFNSTGDNDGIPKAFNGAYVALGGDGTTMSFYNQGAAGYNSASQSYRMKMHLYNSGGRTFLTTQIYAIDSQGNISDINEWTKTSTVLSTGASWTEAVDSFGIKNAVSSTSAAAIFYFDNIYFSTEGYCTDAMPAPSWTIKNSYEGQYNINLVQNAGFEYYAVNGTYGDIPKYWDETNWHGSYSSTFAISSSEVDGAQSLRIYDYSSSQTVGLESEYIPVTPGYVYRASIWATRYSGDNSAKAFLRVRWYDSGKNYISQTPSANTNSTSWTELVKSAATAPVNAAYARLFVYSDGTATGRVYFDDACLILANERINDGDFGDQTVGQIPAYWQVWGTHTGASQNVYSESGNNVVKIVDASTTSTSGIYYKVPVSPLVPYRAQADARRVAGTGVAYLYLKFYDANDNQIFSGSNHTASSSYGLLAVDGIAPANTAYGRVLLYSSTGSEGTFYFDNISFQEHYQTIKYVSPTGTGDGNTYASPAAATSSVLWSAVHNASNNGPVKVIFESGTYTDKLHLDGLGFGWYQIVLEAEKPFGVLFNPQTATDLMIQLEDSQNVIVRHFHFTYWPPDYVSPYPYELGYCISIDNSSYIRIQGCSGVDVRGICYGFTGAHHGDAHDVVWEMCSTVRTGLTSAHAHSYYNAYGAYNLTIKNCYSQDTAGADVKVRDDCKNVVVKDCTFIRTGDYTQSPIIGQEGEISTNTCFVYISGGGEEILPKGVVFDNSKFDYMPAAGVGDPMVIKIEGGSPYGTLYQIPIEAGHELETLTAPAYSSYRNSLLITYCDYDVMGGDFATNQNCDFDGCSSELLRLWRKNPVPYGADWWGSTLRTTNMWDIADITALMTAGW